MKRIIAAVATLLLCLVGTTVSAQSGYQVKGVVVDAAGPVIGATVMEQGTQNGIATGLDGDYILNVSGPMPLSKSAASATRHSLSRLPRFRPRLFLPPTPSSSTMWS